MREDFQFYLKASDSIWYVQKPEGVTTTSIETPLTFSPDKWQETELKWGRSFDWRTLRRTFSTPYQFVKDGAGILRFLFHTYGIEASCKLVLKKLRTSDLVYVDYYAGDIDFSTYQDNITHVQCEIAEAGMAALIKAYGNTPTQINLIGSSTALVYSDGIKLRGVQNYVPTQYMVTPSALPPNKYIGFPIYESNVEGDYPIALTNNSVFAGNMGFPDFVEPEDRYNYIFEAGQAQRVSVAYKDRVNFYKNDNSASDASFKVLALVVNKNASISTNNVSQTILLYQDPVNIVNGPGRTVDIEVKSAQFDLVEGDQIFIVIIITPVSSGGANLYGFNWNGITGSYVKVASDFRLAPSTFAGMRLFNLITRLSDNATNKTNSVQSALLNSPNLKLKDWRPYWTMATCGDSLRGLGGINVVTGRYEVPAIKTNLNESLEAVFALVAAGVAIENEKLVIEQIGYFFDKNTEIIDLGEVTDLRVSIAQEYYASTLRIGYENQTYDGLNGKDEFNTSQTYKLPITRATETTNLVSPYRADCYGMEIYRANLSQKKTTDSSSDNDTFMVCVSETTRTDGSYPLNRPQNNTGGMASGLIFPDSVYNLEITPKRNLLRNATWLKMMTYLQSGKKITFQVTDKNPNVSSNLGSGVVVENADVDVDSLDALPFLPVYLQVSAVCKPLNEILSSNPKGYFAFTYKGNRFKGFLDSAGVRPARYDAYEFQFLAHPDMDLLTLVNACAQ